MKKIFVIFINIKNNLNDLNNEPNYSEKADKYGYNKGFINTPNGIRYKLTQALDKIGEGLNAFSNAEKILNELIEKLKTKHKNMDPRLREDEGRTRG